MKFNKDFYNREFKRLLKTKNKDKNYIRDSNASFKIKKLINKAEASFELAKFVKDSKQKAKDYWTITISYYSMLYIAKAMILTQGYETDDHYATQIALGYLFVPDKLKEEDVNALDNAYDLFEEEYINYFEEAREESFISRYHTTKVYSQRRVEEIFYNSKKFIGKLLISLEEWNR